MFMEISLSPSAAYAAKTVLQSVRFILCRTSRSSSAVHANCYGWKVAETGVVVDSNLPVDFTLAPSAQTLADVFRRKLGRIALNLPFSYARVIYPTGQLEPSVCHIYRPLDGGIGLDYDAIWRCQVALPSKPRAIAHHQAADERITVYKQKKNWLNYYFLLAKLLGY